MPATYTHHLFTKDIYKKLNINLNENLFYLFGKSFDVFFFINSQLGSKCHQTNVNPYFKNIIHYIKEHNLTNNPDVLAYLYGSLCHYIMDSTIHPYVYYKTGKYEKNKKETYKYRGKHNRFESMIDAILYQDRNNKPMWSSNVSKEIFTHYFFSKDLKNTIDYTFDKTHNIENGSSIYIKGIRNYKLAYKHLFESHHGLKIPFYKLVDKFNLISFKPSGLSTRIKKLDYSILNVDHKTWCYPVDKTKKYNYSFYDLYDICLNKAISLINEINNNFNNDELLSKTIKKIGNLGYGTGINCKNKKEMKYFEI